MFSSLELFIMTIGNVVRRNRKWKIKMASFKYKIYSRFIGQVDLEEIDFAFQIVFLCCLQAEICVFKVKFRSGVRHLEFLLPVRSYSIPNVSLG